MSAAKWLGAAGAVVLLAGCSLNQRCEGVQRYQEAETLPTPSAIDGLTIPDSPAAMRIPAAPAEPVPYGRKLTDPNTKETYTSCLDTPPRIALPEKTKTSKERAQDTREKIQDIKPTKAE